MDEPIRAQEPEEETTRAVKEELSGQTQADLPPEEELPEELPGEELPEELPGEQTEQPEEEPAEEGAEEAPAGMVEPKKTRTVPLWAAVAVIAALAAVIVFCVVKISRDRVKPEPAATAAETQTAETAPGTDAPAAPEQLGNGISYTAEREELTDEVLSRVVASCNADQLTNRELPLYYWQQYYSFANSYSYYLSYILDPELGLDEQMYDADKTWQQMFLQAGVEMYQAMSALCQEADANGFTLSDEAQQELDAMREHLTESAVSAGFADADAYVQTVYGPTVTFDDYQEFIRRNFVATEYLTFLTDQTGYSEQDVIDFYESNRESFDQNGLARDDRHMVNVRHILITPTDRNEDGSYTDEAWAEAEQKAQALLDEWLAGDQTEEHFAQLATDNTEDPGSAGTGGLYEEVYPGQMVEPFDAWCFDDSRAVGDTGLVRTDYGYHVMYYSGLCPVSYWYKQIESEYLADLSYQAESEVISRYSMGVTYENAAIYDVLRVREEVS